MLFVGAFSRNRDKYEIEKKVNTQKPGLPGGRVKREIWLKKNE